MVVCVCVAVRVVGIFALVFAAHLCCGCRLTSSFALPLSTVGCCECGVRGMRVLDSVNVNTWREVYATVGGWG